MRKMQPTRSTAAAETAAAGRTDSGSVGKASRNVAGGLARGGPLPGDSGDAVELPQLAGTRHRYVTGVTVP